MTPNTWVNLVRAKATEMAIEKQITFIKNGRRYNEIALE